MSKRILIVNEDFTPSPSFIDEYVATPDALPNLLTDVLMDFDADIDTKRMKIYEKYPHLEALDERESEITLNLLKEGKNDEAHNYQVRMAVDFVEKYPYFKIMIEGVESQSSNIIRHVLSVIRQSFMGEF